MFLVTPLSAATGTIAIDKSYITTPGGTLKVTVTDDDLNIGVLQDNEATDFAGAGYAAPAGNAGGTAGATFFDRVKKFPIMDSLTGAAADGVVNHLDIVIACATCGAGMLPVAGDSTANIEFVVLSIDPNSGLVTFLVTIVNEANLTPAFTLDYVASGVQTTTVQVTSTQDATGIAVILTETGANTGIFENTFDTDAATNDGDDEILASTGSVVTATYDDGGTNRAATSTVETTAPTVTITAPADDSSTTVQSTRLVAEHTDADSLILASSIAFTVTNVNGGAVGGVAVGTITTTAIAGGFRAEALLTGVGAGTSVIDWTAKSNDNAGNLTTSAVTTVTVDTVAPAFAAPIGAETGHFWDSAADPAALVSIANLTKNTSVRAIFSEAIDGTTVAAADFTVDGVAPAAAEWFAGAEAKSVFLTVAALASDALPVVALVGEVSDTAGNPRPAGINATARDGIAPSLTVTSTPILGSGSVVIEMVSDEPLLVAPTLTINDLDDGAENSVGIAGATVPVLVATNTYRSTFDPTATTPRAYNVEVSIQDVSANARTIGTTASNVADAHVFEVDGAIPAPALTPANGASITSSNPFINIDWTSEGTEYGLSNAFVSLNNGTETIDQDTNDAVTLTKVTLDGVDKLAEVGEESTALWLLATSGLALGDHVLIVAGTDAAGNVSGDITATFTVAAKAAFVVPLTTGWNLVSIPGTPTSTAINDVIAATSAVDIVLAYDPSTAGGWTTATRASVGGALAGTLTTIDASTAYWMHTTSFADLSVTISDQTGGTSSLLPTLSLSKGWNMVPVLDVTGTATSATTIAKATYFANITDTNVYQWDVTNSRYAAAGVNLNFGKGYWVYLTAAGVLVP
jgi:hypothetical protein